MNLIVTDLVNTTTGSAPGLDGDRLSTLLNEGQLTPMGFSDHPDYLYLLAQLDTIHQSEPRAWPYIYITGSNDHQIIYIVDLMAKYEPARAAKFTEVDETISPTLVDLAQPDYRTQNDDINIEKDKWGSWVSAFAPIRNAQGQVVGALGVDFDANYVIDVQNEIRKNILLVFLVSYPLMLILVFFISKSLTLPITNLTSIACQIGDGNYDQDFSIFGPRTFPDEISTLADVFQQMLGKVNSREQKLRRQVAELIVEIDEKKRRDDVSQIIETDFFRNLQANADAMRQRNQLDDD